MKIYDISLTISSSLLAWPGEHQPEIKQKMKLEEGDIATVTYLKMGAHTGTHLDAPAHFIKGGKTVESLKLETLIGPALVIEALEANSITKAVLEEAQIPAETERLLIKTRNSEVWVRGDKDFDPSYVAISVDGAEYLVERGVKLVGVDYLSVAPFNDVVPTHETLLGAEVVALEGLDLSDISPGIYTLYALPIKIAGADGAPTRAILIDEKK